MTWNLHVGEQILSKFSTNHSISIDDAISMSGFSIREELSDGMDPGDLGELLNCDGNGIGVWYDDLCLDICDSVSDIHACAAALYDGGWRAEDEDQLFAETDLTGEDVTSICALLKEFEAKEQKE